MMRKVVFWPGLGKSHLHHQLGLVAQVMSKNRVYRKYPTAVLSLWIEPALRHRQIGIFFDEYNAPIGYMTWALLADDVIERWKSQPDATLHESEWNEGSTLWILDFVVAPGWVRDVLRMVRVELFPEHDGAWSLRRDDRGLVRRVTCWRRTNRPDDTMEPALPERSVQSATGR